MLLFYYFFPDFCCSNSLHFLFVKVDIDLFVIINILFFVWFLYVCLVECSTQWRMLVKPGFSYNHNRKHCFIKKSHCVLFICA